MDSKQHLIVGADIEPGQPGPYFVNSHMQSRRRHGIRGWLAIVTLVAVSFVSYGGMLYLFDIYVKGEAGAFASMTLH